MSAADADAAEKCPVDHKTRERWLEAAKARGEKNPAHPTVNPRTSSVYSTGPNKQYFSLDTMSWQDSTSTPASSPVIPRPKMYRLSTDREISTIPRAVPTNHDRMASNRPGAATSVPSPIAASHGTPANSERDTGHDAASGNWIYPSQEMFFAAMRRKGHTADPSDMASIVPIHNAVNERAWVEIKAWEAGRGSEACGGPKLVSFSGDSSALTPRARWNALMGYQKPFDRHDWVVDRCGKRIDYVIDFYAGKPDSEGKGLSFYLDVRPKLNTWEGIRTRAMKAVGW